MNAAVRAGFRTLSAISPALAARLASRLWFRIPKPRVGPTAKAFLDTGERLTMDVNGRAVSCWRWGVGPTVILMHGWGGHAGQFQTIVPALTEAGMSCLAFDAPSHGASAPGSLGARYSTLFEFADALRVVYAHAGRPVGIVAHSGGCAAAAWAMANDPALAVPRAVFVAPFGRPGAYLEVFRETIGITDAALALFVRATEEQFRFRWKDLDVPDMAARMTPPPTLVIHDRADRETMWQDGADIAGAWPGASLTSTIGLGHNRILRDPGIVALIVAHLAASAYDVGGAP